MATDADIEGIRDAALECCRHAYSFGRENDGSIYWTPFDVAELRRAVDRGRDLIQPLMDSLYRPTASPHAITLPTGGKGYLCCGISGQTAHGCGLNIGHELATSQEKELEPPRLERREIMTLWGAIQHEYGTLKGKCNGGTPAATGDGEPADAEAVPVVWLTSWNEILEVLELKRGDLDKVKSLNERFQGPIQLGGQGGQPLVSKVALIAWWNKLDSLHSEQANQRTGRKLAAESQHNYGREGRVAPEVGGSVKRRRRQT